MPRLPRAPRPALTILLFLVPSLIVAACSDSGDDARPAAATPTRVAAVAGAVGEVTGASQLSAIDAASPEATLGAADGSSPVAALSAPAASATTPPVTHTPIVEAAASTATPETAPQVESALAPTSTAVPLPTETPAPLPTPTTAPATATPVPPAPTATKAAATLASAAPSSSLGAHELTLINQYRAANGRSLLRGDAALNNEAFQYAKLLGDSNTFGHNGPDASTPFTRFAAAGFGGAMCGEALAAGQDTAAAVLDTWKASPSHNAILLGAGADSVGIGYYYAPNSTYKHYWVLVTGKAGTANCP